jgi:hypothetical protein
MGDVTTGGGLFRVVGLGASCGESAGVSSGSNRAPITEPNNPFPPLTLDPFRTHAVSGCDAGQALDQTEIIQHFFLATRQLRAAITAVV